MLETLLDWDTQATLWINHWGSPSLDGLMEFWSRKAVWIPLYLALLAVVFRQLGWRAGLALGLTIALGIALSDQICSALLKPWVARLRPCHDPTLSGLLKVPFGCGGTYGFASSHAANTAFLAVFIGFFPNRLFRFRAALLLWALVTGWSRIYLGAHFLGDVLVGWGIGGAVAFGLQKAWFWARTQFGLW